jgi:endo-1,4-beta-mannosidase
MARLLVVIMLVLLSACGPAGTGGADPVTRSGTRLLLDGRPVRLTGVNVYNAASASAEDCWYPMGASLDGSLDTISTQTQGRVNVIRVWFFQHLAVRAGLRDWTMLDHVVAAAKAHHMLVLPVLGNQWGDCERPSGYHGEDWYRTGYRAPDPAGTVPYRAWVVEVARRYRGDPAIAAWTLMNEPEDAVAKNGACPPDATAVLRSFADDVATLVKKADPAHLVTFGTVGGSQCGTAGDEYRRLYASPALDLCEYHDYGSPGTPMPGDQINGLQIRLDQCTALHKPLLVAESGIDPATVGGTSQRAADFAAKASAEFSAGIAGLLVWEWRAAAQTGGDPYVIGPGDPALSALADHGTRL